MKKITIAIACGAAIAGCGNNSQTDARGNPTQHQAGSTDTGSMLMGGMLGYLLGRNNTPAPVVKAASPPPAPAPAAPKPPAPPPPAATPKPSYAGPSSYGSVRQSMPTYRPSPSFSGGRR